MKALAEPRPGDVWVPHPGTPAMRRTVVDLFGIGWAWLRSVRYIEDGRAKVRSLREFNAWAQRTRAQPMPDPMPAVAQLLRD